MVVLAIAPGCLSGETGERSGLIRSGMGEPLELALEPARCDLDRRGGCAGAWCESLEAQVSRDPCAVFEALSVAPCHGGSHAEQCGNPYGPRLVELAAKVGDDFVPLVRNRVRCGRMRIVPSSCSPGLRVTYQFRNLPDGLLLVQSGLDSVHLDSHGEANFSTVLCGSCAQFGRLDGGWQPSTPSEEDLQRLAAQLPE